jgi:hypothetical protein
MRSQSNAVARLAPPIPNPSRLPNAKAQLLHALVQRFGAHGSGANHLCEALLGCLTRGGGGNAGATLDLRNLPSEARHCVRHFNYSIFEALSVLAQARKLGDVTCIFVGPPAEHPDEPAFPQDALTAAVDALPELQFVTVPDTAVERGSWHMKNARVTVLYAPRSLQQRGTIAATAPQAPRVPEGEADSSQIEAKRTKLIANFVAANRDSLQVLANLKAGQPSYVAAGYLARRASATDDLNENIETMGAAGARRGAKAHERTLTTSRTSQPANAPVIIWTGAGKHKG